MKLKTFEEMQKTSVFFMLKPANAIYGFIITIFVSILVILIWAIFAPMDDVVKASVLLRPEQAISSIKCVNNGELAAKYFENDTPVKQGDLLFTLDTTSYKSQLETYRAEIIKNQNEIYVNSKLLETIEKQSLPEISKNTEAYIKCSSYLTEYERYKNGITDLTTKLDREKNKPVSLKIPQTIQDLQTELNQKELAFEGWKN